MVRINKDLFRPKDVNYLKGDSSKIKKKIGWEPKYTLEQIISEMVDFEFKNVNSNIF